MEDLPNATLRRAPVRVHAFRCLRERHHAAPCLACREACPYQAITLAAGPTIDPARCDGCGVCAAVCPTAALELRALSPDDLLAEVGGGRGEFHCRHAASPAAAGGGSEGRSVAVPCLGFLDAGLLLAAVVAGAAVALEAGPCQDCPAQAGLRTAEAAVATANAVLAAAGDERRIAFLRRRTYVAREEVSRRGLFGLLRQKARGHFTADPERPATPVAKGKAARGTLSPRRRALLAGAVHRLLVAGEQRPAAAAAEAALPFYDLAIGEACDNCGMCLTFCPTAALRAERGEGQAAFVFTPDLCLGCDVCRVVCPRQAVSLSRAAALPPPRSRRALLTRPLRRCERCGEVFPARADERLCPDCAKQRSLEDAIRRTLFGG